MNKKKRKRGTVFFCGTKVVTVGVYDITKIILITLCGGWVQALFQNSVFTVAKRALKGTPLILHTKVSLCEVLHSLWKQLLSVFPCFAGGQRKQPLRISLGPSWLELQTRQTNERKVLQTESMKIQRQEHAGSCNAGIFVMCNLVFLELNLHQILKVRIFPPMHFFKDAISRHFLSCNWNFFQFVGRDVLMQNDDGNFLTFD